MAPQPTKGRIFGGLRYLFTNQTSNVHNENCRFIRHNGEFTQASPILEEIVGRLRKLDPEKIILFDSTARGEQDCFSDVDLIVVYQTSKRFLDRLGELQNALGYGIPIGVDMLGYTSEELERLLEERAFIQDAVREGVVLYEKQPPGSQEMVSRSEQ